MTSLRIILYYNFVELIIIFFEQHKGGFSDGQILRLKEQRKTAQTRMAARFLAFRRRGLNPPPQLPRIYNILRNLILLPFS